MRRRRHPPARGRRRDVPPYSRVCVCVWTWRVAVNCTRVCTRRRYVRSSIRIRVLHRSVPVKPSRAVPLRNPGRDERVDKSVTRRPAVRGGKRRRGVCSRELRSVRELRRSRRREPGSAIHRAPGRVRVRVRVRARGESTTRERRLLVLKHLRGRRYFGRHERRHWRRRRALRRFNTLHTCQRLHGSREPRGVPRRRDGFR